MGGAWLPRTNPQELPLHIHAACQTDVHKTETSPAPPPLQTDVFRLEQESETAKKRAEVQAGVEMLQNEAAARVRIKKTELEQATKLAAIQAEKAAQVGSWMGGGLACLPIWGLGSYLIWEQRPLRLKCPPGPHFKFKI